MEQRVNGRLPDDYRQFLIENNGGRPEPNTIDVPGLAGGNSDIQVFFRIGGAVKTSELDWNLDVLSERLAKLPLGLLPIACDSGGSCYMLALQGHERGAVYYCDLQSVFADYDAVPKLHFVASSFGEFLEQIYPFKR